MPVSLRILVVEDEAISAMAISMMLESSGYTIIAVADTGADAIKLASELKPDLVLMDIRLKGDMSGVESGKAIQAHLHIPIIIMTAYTADEVRTSYELDGEFQFLSKPVREDLLAEAVLLACASRNDDTQR